MLVVAAVVASSVSLYSIGSIAAQYQRLASLYSSYSASQEIMLVNQYAARANYAPGYIGLLAQALRVDGLSVVETDGSLIVYEGWNAYVIGRYT